jgi:hypothetical protein
VAAAEWQAFGKVGPSFLITGHRRWLIRLPTQHLRQHHHRHHCTVEVEVEVVPMLLFIGKKQF